MLWSQFSIKIVGVHFDNSAHDNRTSRDKTCDKLTEKIHIWDRMQLSFRGQNNLKSNPLIKTMIVRPNIYCSKIYLKENFKKFTIFFGATKNKTSQAPSSVSYLESK